MRFVHLWVSHHELQHVCPTRFLCVYVRFQHLYAMLENLANFDFFADIARLSRFRIASERGLGSLFSRKSIQISSMWPQITPKHHQSRLPHAFSLLVCAFPTLISNFGRLIFCRFFMTFRDFRGSGSPLREVWGCIFHETPSKLRR